MPRNATKPRETYHVGNLEPQLLIQAKRMLEEVGPTKISIRAIAEQLGVSATAVYYHFANKDELLSRLAATGFSELEFVLNQALAESTATTILKEVSLAYFRFAKRNPTMYQLMFGVQMTCCAQRCSAQEGPYKLFTQVIAEVMKDSNPSQDIIKQKYFTFFSVIHGLIAINIINKSDILETINAQILKDAIGGIIKSIQ